LVNLKIKKNNIGTFNDSQVLDVVTIGVILFS